MQGKAQFGPYQVTEKSKFIYASSDRFDEQVDRLRAIRFGNLKYIRNFNLEISNAIPISYREQMPMMQQLNQLWEAQELELNAAAWFKVPKPIEELYDLEQDPYELKNLAGEIEFIDTLAFFRDCLDQWIVETQDLGEYSEKELINKWFPNGNPRVLSPLSNKVEAGKIYFNHSDEGATIVWKKTKDSVWSIYSEPLDFLNSIEAKAVRIGYDDSPILIFN